jgi:hypothetical protein
MGGTENDNIIDMSQRRTHSASDRIVIPAPVIKKAKDAIASIIEGRSGEDYLRAESISEDIIEAVGEIFGISVLPQD